MADGLWLYGVLSGDAPDPPPLTGPDGRHRVQLLRQAGLAALVAAVPLDEFGAEALRRRLEDLERLEALARAHEEVLDAALALGPVVPFRLCTIYEGADGVRAMLERERAGLAAALARLDGMVELGVKGFLARAPAAADQPAAAATSGTDYLARKRAARDAAEVERGATADTAAAVHVRLAEHAADAVLSRPQDRRLSGRDAEMVLNASYLVAAERAEEFRTLVGAVAREHGADGLELEATGPWPAYHFVTADEHA